MIVNIHAAKTNLSKLIAAAERGEEVVIARAGKAAVKIVAVAEQRIPKTSFEQGRGRSLWGSWKDMWPGPSLKEWNAMDKEIEALFENSEIFPK